MNWQTSRFLIDLTRPRVMGIVNVTPDSFSDGGRFDTPSAALAHCEKLLAEGADLLDIGAESTRPGAPPVPLHEELDRLLPVLREAVTLGVPVSVDTYKPEVMQAALDLGADVINDVWALRMPGALQAVAAHPGCGVCLMHMHREPLTMQAQPMTGDVVPQVAAFLAARVADLEAMGVARVRIAVDPGIGFGKTPEQNFRLLARQPDMAVPGCAVLAGWSRKSSLAPMTAVNLSSAASLNPQERMVPSVAAALLAVERGARVVRVHDVRPTVQALQVWVAQQSQAAEPGLATSQ